MVIISNTFESDGESLRARRLGSVESMSSDGSGAWIVVDGTYGSVWVSSHKFCNVKVVVTCKVMETFCGHEAYMNL